MRSMDLVFLFYPGETSSKAINSIHWNIFDVCKGTESLLSAKQDSGYKRLPSSVQFISLMIDFPLVTAQNFLWWLTPGWNSTCAKSFFLNQEVKCEILLATEYKTLHVQPGNRGAMSCPQTQPRCEEYRSSSHCLYNFFLHLQRHFSYIKKFSSSQLRKMRHSCSDSLFRTVKKEVIPLIFLAWEE